MQIVKTLADEKQGFRFGKPTRVDDKSLAVILPIIRETSIKRQYVTFPETDKVHVFDTGSISEMEANNTTEENVFLRSGTLFKGSTQERALLRSAVLFPGKKVKLGVRCVHQTRGIQPNAKTAFGGLTPHDFDKQVYGSGYAPKDQHAYWCSATNSTQKMARLSGNAIGKYASGPTSSLGFHGQNVQSDGAVYGWAHGAHSPQMSTHQPSGMDDLAAHLDKFSLHFDELLSKIKLRENQSGLALITQSGVETVEIFDHPDSWKALHESAVKRLGSSVVGGDEEQVFEYKPDVAVNQVKRVLAMDWKENRIFEHQPSNGEPHVKITGLSSGRFVGEVVEVNGAVIHMVLLKTDGN